MRQKSTILTLGLMVAVLIGPSLSAQAKGSRSGPCSTNVNVTSIVADTDGNSHPFQFQSDSLGAYVTYNNSKTDSVTSEIQANSCDWILQLSNSLSRTVALTFAAATQASNLASPPFAGTQKVGAYIISKCGKNSLNSGQSYGTMTFAGETLQCGLSAAFGYNGKQYALRMEPNNFAGTDWVEVACTGAASNLCNAWTVRPIPNMVTNPSTGLTSSIGELMQVTTVKGSTVYTSLGLYYVAFYVTVTR